MINIKNNVAQESWPDFGNKDFYQPVVYGTKENTFVLNPNDHIRKITDHEEIPAFDKVSVIKLSEEFTDTTNFSFSVSFSSDSTALHYNSNVLYCQSFELTKKFLQNDLVDLEDWSIMVMHELFHGYQRSFPEAHEYRKTFDIPGGPDQFLGSYHNDLEWYSESVRKENDLLKAIWIDGADLTQNLTAYDSLRNLRIDKIKKEYGVDIRDAEDFEITIEGNARYFESLVKRYLAKNEPNGEALHKSDQALITNMFDEYEVSKDKALFNIYNNRYWYPIGYNISMILEKYEVDYKDSLYREEHNIHSFLEELKSSKP
ncbi:MAG: hypothetical protein HWE15_10060 [Algoriphagus sp.]|uniref:hypothetical protein n=1 Tax=Algoriphagus sp. TaxID=1872435 RepID=UPI001831C5FA|nr:hypothetical protein [Algoriphagus sp.]NVJ86638.1 hypothetical protein [Algoriphagus sp.]